MCKTKSGSVKTGGLSLACLVFAIFSLYPPHAEYGKEENQIKEDAIKNSKP